MLTKVKMGSHMYQFVSHCGKNYVAGHCEHDCCYCSNRSFAEMYPAFAEKYSGPYRLIEKELTENMGSGKTIFVENCGDLFAKGVPDEMIRRVLAHCCKFPDNTYLFQSKNPQRFHNYVMDGGFPPKRILCTTLDTTDDVLAKEVSPGAPVPSERTLAMVYLRNHFPDEELMVTIEPILGTNFDVEKMVGWVKRIKPKWVNLGADSKNHKLPEPSKETVEALIKGLQAEGIEVIGKSNLGRLFHG